MIDLDTLANLSEEQTKGLVKALDAYRYAKAELEAARKTLDEAKQAIAAVLGVATFEEPSTQRSTPAPELKAPESSGVVVVPDALTEIDRMTLDVLVNAGRSIQLDKIVTKVGRGKSTVHGALARLICAGKVKRLRAGIYIAA